MAKKIKAFFRDCEDVWASIPGYIKVFAYSVVSSTAGLYFADDLSLRAVFAIVLFNLGLYNAPRALNTQIKKLK